MTNNHIKDGLLHLQVGQMQTVVADQIRFTAQKSFGIKKGELELLIPFDFVAHPEYDLPVPPTNEILFCDKLGNALARYRINSSDHYLEEWQLPGGSGYVPFQVGSDTAFIDDANSQFLIYPGRRGVELRLAMKSKGGTYSFPVMTETILCRNPI